MCALIAAAILAFRLRGRPAFRLTLWAALGFALSLATWLVLVQPVNAEWGRALATASEAEAVEAYAQLRNRWEYGHAAAFIAWLGGLIFVIASVLADTPKEE